jgi:hypothetical protein
LSTYSSLPINEHPFSIKPDPKVAAKWPLARMWQEDDTVHLSLPMSPSKHLSGHPFASLTGAAKSSQLLIEHHCGFRVIKMTVNEDNIGSWLNNLRGDKLCNVAFALTHEQIEWIQSLVDPEPEEPKQPFKLVG